jgi:hypothetical protein
MGKMKCKCGHLIRDVSSHLPYLGTVIPDDSFDDFFEKYDDIMFEYFKAKNENKHNEFITTYLGATYPKDSDDKSVMNDVISILNSSKAIYQCEKCGRILIQKGNSQKYVSFIPEDLNWKDILSIKDISKNEA